MAAYAITVIPMILTIVDITSKIDDSTQTADWAEEKTLCNRWWYGANSFIIQNETLFQEQSWCYNYSRTRKEQYNSQVCQ